MPALMFQRVGALEATTIEARGMRCSTCVRTGTTGHFLCGRSVLALALPRSFSSMAFQAEASLDISRELGPVAGFRLFAEAFDGWLTEAFGAVASVGDFGVTTLCASWPHEAHISDIASAS